MNLNLKIIIFNFSDASELTGMAFYDASLYIVSMKVIKNYILCGDVYKSIFFLRWKVRPLIKGSIEADAGTWKELDSAFEGLSPSDGV